METVAVKASNRSEVRSKGAKATRAEGKIPCVVYGGDTVHTVAVDFNDIRHAIYTPAFKLVELDIDGESVSCIVKDIQFHPVTEDIVHIDFLILTPGKSIKVEVPVRFEGAAPGIRAGGKLIKKMRRVKIKTTPETLVDHLLVDISNLELGYSVRVKDIEAVEGVEVLNQPNIPVASIEVPRALRSADEEGAEFGEDGEEEGGEEGSEEGGEEAASE